MKQLLCAFFCLVFVSGFAQNEDTFTISIDNTELTQKIAIPFSAVKVIDARFDKSNVGCVVKDLSFKGMTKNKFVAVFPDSLHTYLPKILDDIILWDKGTADTLVILIKQFRIADHLSNTFDTYHSPETVLTLSASFYKKESDKLKKLFSLNNSWARSWEITNASGKNELNNQRNDVIVALLDTVFDGQSWSPTQTVFSWKDMEDGLQKRFRLQLYSDTILKSGVYKTFDEFKSNNPSITNVNLGMREGELVNVLDENNLPINMRDFWGACDGKNKYVVFRGVLHKLLPSDKSFKFRSYRQEKKDRHMLGTSVTKLLVLGPQSVDDKPGTRTKPEYFYINMDTGRICLEELAGTENYEKAIRALNNNVY